MSKKVVMFGEIMLRLAPEGYYRFFQNDQMQATFGGSEANVSVLLASFGIDSAYVTKLPEHAIGQAAVNTLRYFGVDTSHIVRGGDRIGIYFLEKGASQRPSMCIYDRAHSAISEAERMDFDWDKIFEGAGWFHFTGITPALGKNLPLICEDACKAAKKKGITVSMDTNYRSKLWSLDEARPVIQSLCKNVDVCFTNPGDAKDIFGIVSDKKDFVIASPENEGCISIAKKLISSYGFKTVCLTLRRNISASDNEFSGMISDGKGFCFSRKYNMHIVDRVGGGDSFCAGIIYSLLNNSNLEDTIDFGVASSVLKHTIEGDLPRITVPEVEKLAYGDGSGRVIR